MTSVPGPILFLFAVREEAAALRKSARSREQDRILVTGMGERNAAAATRKALAESTPALVLTCGYAGGLRPELRAGEVLFATDSGPELAQALAAAGARPGRFACVPRVLSTAREKAALFETTGADAVEMESRVIHEVCREHRIPCATVRVILDTAGEDLPLDFNALMTPDLRMNYVRLAGVLAKSPDKIPALLRFQRQSAATAGNLARVLSALRV